VIEGIETEVANIFWQFREVFSSRTWRTLRLSRSHQDRHWCASRRWTNQWRVFEQLRNVPTGHSGLVREPENCDIWNVCLLVSIQVAFFPITFIFIKNRSVNFVSWTKDFVLVKRKLFRSHNNKEAFVFAAHYVVSRTVKGMLSRSVKHHICLHRTWFQLVCKTKCP